MLKEGRTFMARQLRLITRMSLMGLIMLILIGCSAAPMVIDREAKAAVVTDTNWHHKWHDSNVIHETRTVMGREITVIALSHVGLWNLKANAAIALVATPQLTVFGIDANPAANLSDQQLVRFILDSARSQADEVLGLELPANLVLEKISDQSVEASIGLMTGSQFRVDTKGLTVTLLILRAKSDSDHVVALGLVPNSSDQDALDAVIDAVKTIKHPD